MEALVKRILSPLYHGPRYHGGRPDIHFGPIGNGNDYELLHMRGNEGNYLAREVTTSRQKQNGPPT